MPKRYVIAIVDENTECQERILRSFPTREEAETWDFTQVLRELGEVSVAVAEMEAVMTSPALHGQSPEYPMIYNGRVPKRVRMLCTVHPDDFRVVISQGRPYPVADRVYDGWVDAHGAVSAIFGDGTLQELNSDEFEVVEWHEGAEGSSGAETER